MPGRLDRFRGMAVLPLAALAVHQLRYQLAFGADAERRLAAEGHAYLGSVETVAIVLCAVAVGGFLTRLAGAWCGRAVAPGAARRLGTLKLWAAATVALMAIYTGQELLEGWLAAGHPPGVEGVVGNGGWLAAPLSLVIGALLALLLRGAHAVLALVRRASSARRLAAERRPLPRPRTVLLRRRSPLAVAAAGRAPPRAGAHAT